MVEGGKGRGRKTWHECVVDDMRKLKVAKRRCTEPGDLEERNLWEPSNPR